MPSCYNVLVLVANENCATLSANSEGETRLLRSINRAPLPQQMHSDSDLLLVTTSARHLFASELMMALGRDLRDRPYDGVVIFADLGMMAELRTVATSEVSRLLIALIAGTPSAPGLLPGFGAAHGDMVGRRALH